MRGMAGADGEAATSSEGKASEGQAQRLVPAVPEQRRLLGVDEGDVLHRLCYQVLQADCCRTDCPLGITLETGTNVYEYELRVKDREGRPIDLTVNCAILRDDEGAPIGGVVSFNSHALEAGGATALVRGHSSEGMIGRSEPMRRLHAQIREVAARTGARLRAAVLVATERGQSVNAVAATSSGTIYLAEGLWEGLEGEEVRAVLLHELGHFAQRWTNVYRNVSVVIMPAAVWLARQR